MSSSNKLSCSAMHSRPHSRSSWCYAAGCYATGAVRGLMNVPLMPSEINVTEFLYICVCACTAGACEDDYQGTLEGN
jgi:hypothetical protein